MSFKSNDVEPLGSEEEEEAGGGFGHFISAEENAKEERRIIRKGSEEVPSIKMVETQLEEVWTVVQNAFEEDHEFGKQRSSTTRKWNDGWSRVCDRMKGIESFILASQDREKRQSLVHMKRVASLTDTLETAKWKNVESPKKSPPKMTLSAINKLWDTSALIGLGSAREDTTGASKVKESASVDEVTDRVKRVSLQFNKKQRKHSKLEAVSSTGSCPSDSEVEGRVEPKSKQRTRKISVQQVFQTTAKRGSNLLNRLRGRGSVSNEKTRRRSSRKGNRKGKALSRRESTAKLQNGLHVHYPMWLVPVSEFMAMKWLQPHQRLRDRGKLVEYNPSMQTIFFVSHQWAADSHPDPSMKKLRTFQQILARMLVGNLPGTAMLRTPEDIKISSEEWQKMVPDAFIWMDYMCVPQLSSSYVVEDEDVQGTVSDMKKAVLSIPAYIIRCSHFFVLCPETTHAQRHEELTFGSWLTRGWCRAELFSFLLSHCTAKGEGYPIIVTGGDKTPHIIEPYRALCSPPGTGNFTCCRKNHRFKSKSGKEVCVPCDKIGICSTMTNLIERIEGDLIERGDWSDYQLYHASAKHMLAGLELPMRVEIALANPETVEEFELEYGFVKHGQMDWSPLMIAAISGNAEVVYDLVRKRNVDVNERSKTASPGILGLDRGSTALHCAVVFCKDSDRATFDALTNQGHDVSTSPSNKNKSSSPHHLTTRSTMRYIKRRFTNLMGMKARSNTIMPKSEANEYRKKGRKSVAKMFKNGRASNKRGRRKSTLKFNLTHELSKVQSKGIGGIICTLLEAGANPNACDAFGHTPLMNTIRFQNEAGFKALVRMSKDLLIDYIIPGEHITALGVAAIDSTPHFVKLCLEEDADPLYVLNDGSTVFMHVCMNLDPDPASFDMLARKIDDIVTIHGDDESFDVKRATQCAVWAQRRPTTAAARVKAWIHELLYSVGLSKQIHRAHDRGCSALHIASKHGHDDLVRWLLDNGAERSLYQKNKMGMTPLHMSWEFGPHAHTESLLSSMILRNRSIEEKFKKKYRVSVDVGQVHSGGMQALEALEEEGQSYAMTYCPGTTPV